MTAMTHRAKQIENLKLAIGLRPILLWFACVGGALLSGFVMSLWSDNDIQNALLFGVGLGTYIFGMNCNNAWHDGLYDSKTKQFAEPENFEWSYEFAYVAVIIVSFCGPLLIATKNLVGVSVTALVIIVFRALMCLDRIKVYFQNNEKS